MPATDNDRPYRIDALELGPMENFVYLISDKKTGRAAVVDPAWEVDEVLKLARQRGVTITDILLTHSHHDHINGIQQVLNAHDAQLHLCKAEADFWGKALTTPTLHHGGDIIQLGDTAIEVLHTPGHTPGSACYKINHDLITGDTMFVFGCGRCDLAGGDPEQMFDTLRKLGRLPGDTIIHPGHNYSVKETSTIAEECDGNPFMHFHDKHKFIEYRMHIHDKVRSDPYEAVKRED
ncbi:MAG: MBL fold metallo-hydrolase [Gammaproteobacteria bacterium]|nr:MBL fold metallo-hydrolase [Gammaproteobacteria bacterium]MDH5651584.1 MBL fold metallo-hydrolase [Gammaproteobacteria bacterium]